MVEYAFCDKTGTLTSNEMRLRLLVLDGEVYGRPTFELERCGLPPHAALRAFDARLAAALLDRSSGEEAAAAASGGAGEGEDGAGGGDTSAVPEITSSLQCAAVEAFTALTVCHTLIVEERSSAVAPPKPAAAADDSSAASSSSSSSPPACTAAAAEPPPGADGASAVFQGPSPDEVALVGGAAALGVRFHARSASDVVVDFLGVPLSFEVLAVLEFSSERQRMSVVARRPDGRVTLFCKGADAALLPLLAPPRSAREADVRARTEEHLHELSVLVRARCCAVQPQDVNPAVPATRVTRAGASHARACVT
jgi:magnesium-transporting ATPase (P-type)